MKDRFHTNRYNEWVFIYDGDSCILRMNDADFVSDEEMADTIQFVLNCLNK